MNTVEDRLRDALRERAKHSPIDPDAWDRARARSQAVRRQRAGWRSSRPGGFLVPAAAAAAVAVIVVWVMVTVSAVTGRPVGGPAGAGTTSPAAPVTRPGPVPPPRSILRGYLQTTPVSAIVTMRVTASGTGRTAMAYSWLGYTSPYAWVNELQGLRSCAAVMNPDGGGAGYCVALPRLGAGQPAVVTASNQGLGGPLVLQGLAISRVTSVTAVLPDGQKIPGVVKTGRGFPGKAWAVAALTNGKKPYQPTSGERLVFRDASGAEVASLGTTAALPVLVNKPGSGAVKAFSPPCCGSVYAYLIDGYAGFFWGSPGWMAPQRAAGSPALAGLIDVFATKDGSLTEAFGYAHADVARVVLRLDGGPQVTTATFAAWPGSGLRLWAVRLPAQPGNDANGYPLITATGYDAAGHAIAQVRLGITG